MNLINFFAQVVHNKSLSIGSIISHIIFENFVNMSSFFEENRFQSYIFAD